MANNSAKKQATENAAALKNLQIGMLIVNLIYICVRIGYYRSTYTFWHLMAYGFTSGITVIFYRILSAKGSDLSAKGLTSYMFDIIYVTWFVHLGSALLTDYAWWVYPVIPIYALYKIISIFRSGVIPGMPMAQVQTQGANEQAQPSMSKTQQKRAARSGQDTTKARPARG